MLFCTFPCFSAADWVLVQQLIQSSLRSGPSYIIIFVRIIIIIIIIIVIIIVIVIIIIIIIIIIINSN